MTGRRLSSNDVGVVIALAIVVLVLLLTFLAGRGEGRTDESVAAGTSGARAVVGASAVQPLPGSFSGEARNAGNVDACGGAAAKVADGPSEDEALAAAERYRDDAARAILAALEARPEPRARAAGLYFRAARERIDTRAAEVCKKSFDTCSTLEQRHRDDRDSAEALARLAVNSTDPQVYAWAYRSCAAVAREAAGSCQLVNALQWARLDPANAEPWLTVAREAKSRNGAAGLDDAMFHVAAAAVHDAGWGRAAAQMLEAAPQADRMVVGTLIVSLDTIVYETIDLSSFSDTWRYCDARTLGNANRRDTCEKIASLLVDRSTTLMGRAVGLGLGKRLDWPTARLAAVEKERDAAYAVELRDASAPGEPFSCARARRDLSRLAEVARVGEVEALRRRVAATGESVATLAAETRQTLRLAQEAEVARAAASAASASAASAATAASPYSSAPPPAR